jgi:hypothetical protein
MPFKAFYIHPGNQLWEHLYDKTIVMSLMTLKMTDVLEMRQHRAPCCILQLLCNYGAFSRLLGVAVEALAYKSNGLYVAGLNNNVGRGCDTKKNPSLLQATSAKHRSKFAALSQITVTVTV